MTDNLIHDAVLGAFCLAEEQGQPLHNCYRAAVDTYSELFPDYAREPTAQRAVNIILANRQGELLRVE